MGQESSTEFHQRWVATAETDVQSAKHSFVLWVCLFISNAAVCLSTEVFLPRSGWRVVAPWVFFIPSLIFFVKAALSASDLGDAKKFLRECRGGFTNEVRDIR